MDVRKRRGVIHRPLLFLSTLRKPQILCYGTEQAFQAAFPMELIRRPHCPKKGFLGDLFSNLMISGERERITICRVKVVLIDLVNRIGLYSALTPFHFNRRGSRRNLTKKWIGTAFSTPSYCYTRFSVFEPCRFFRSQASNAFGGSLDAGLPEAPVLWYTGRVKSGGWEPPEAVFHWRRNG